MSSLTSGIGIFSGIDSRSLIDQLIQSVSRPKTLAQQRAVQLQSQQTAFLDLNSRLNSLKTSASAFGLSRFFDVADAATSDATILTGDAATGAAAGSYTFTVDRLVTTQQVLSRGFADSNVSSVGASQFTFESTAARLDANTSLSGVNGGAGIVRGKINVRDSSGQTTLVDLTKVGSVNEVLDAINTSTSGRVNARVDGDRLVVEDRAGGTTTAIQITDANGTTGTVASLGLDTTVSAAGNGGLINGRQINKVGAGTALKTLNDGLGVAVTPASGVSTPDFQIKSRDGRSFDIDLGDIYANQPISATDPTQVLTKTQSAVSDIGGVIARINSQTSGAVTASIGSDGVSLQLTDTTTGTTAFQVLDIAGSSRPTASSLGIAQTAIGGSGTINGSRLIAGLNTSLARNLNGGNGIGDTNVTVTARDGTNFNFAYNASGSVNDLIRSFNTATGGKVTIGLDQNATSFVVQDNTSGTGGLTVVGEGATSLGLNVIGQNVSTVTGTRSQKQYIGQATLVAGLNGGIGIGTGSFKITDSYGATKTVNIDSSVRTIQDVIDRINGSSSIAGDTSTSARARINDNGDGIVIEEAANSSGPGVRSISITDTTGTVGKSLNIVGTAGGLGAANKIDGSFEEKVTFGVGDTLQQVADKINNANGPAIATIVNDGSPGASYRLNFTARNSGENGRFLLDTGGLDLGLTTLSEGSNARVFFGAADPARAVLISSSSNTIAGVASGLTINAKSTSATPVTITVSASTDSVTKGLNDFVKSYNDIVNRLNTVTNYNADTNRKGALLGDSLTQQIQNDLARVINSPPQGVSGRYQFLTQVGVSFNKDGTIALDTDKLNTALTTDRQAVKDLIAAKTANTPVTTQDIPGIPGATVSVSSSATYSSLGIAELVAQTVDKYTAAVTGLIAQRSNNLTAQIKSQNDRVTSIQASLDAKRAVYEKQFLAMESAIGKLKNQSGSLSSIALIK